MLGMRCLVKGTCKGNSGAGSIVGSQHRLEKNGTHGMSEVKDEEEQPQVFP